MSEFKRIKLGDVGQIITGKTPLTKVPSYYDGTIHFVSPADLNNCDKNILHTAKTISNSGLQSIKGCILPKRTICVSCIGNLGYVGITTMECASNQQINSIIVDESRYNVDFIYYTIKHLWRYFKSQENQSTTISIINKSTFSNIEIYSPSLETQKKIASILSSLDDKIAVNKKICENLEAQAQALFKHWFVDFAPFKDGRFVESELGLIPEGWRVGKLGNIAEINPTRKLSKGQIATYLDMKNMPTSGSFPLSWEEKVFSGGMKFKNGDTLMARITPCLENGKVAYVNFLQDEEIGFGSTEYIVMTAKHSIFPELLYTLCRFPLFVGYATKHMNGSSGRQRVSGDSISNYPMVIASDAVYNQLRPIFENFMRQIREIGFENLRLATLRDTLLPKLMSGQIKL